MYVLYRIYVLQNNDGISTDKEKTMGGVWGGFPPLQQIYNYGLLTTVSTIHCYDNIVILVGGVHNNGNN